MTKQEQNQIIKDAMVRNLQKKVDIPTDIGEMYRAWLLQLIQQSAGMLQQTQQSTEQPSAVQDNQNDQGEQPEQQEGQPQ